MPNDNKKLGIFFIITALFALTTPALITANFFDNISSSFANPSSEESFYWILGTFLVWIIFGLISAYMIFSKVKNNVNNRSKLIAFMFMPLLILATVGGGVYIGLEYVSPERGPYLSWMQDPKTTMTISFELEIAGDFEVEYKKQTDSSWTSSPVEFTMLPMRNTDGYYHYIANLTGLDAGTLYRYRIPGFSKEYTFRTAPETQSESFKFLLYGDSRESSKTFDNQHIPLMKQFINTHNEEEFSFAINVGDTAGSHNDVKQWNYHFLAIEDVAASMPYFVASGNHEWNTGEPWYSTENQPAIDIQDFPIGDDPTHDVYSLNETSYAFGYGNAYFIYLGYPHAGCNQPEYLDWLETQLKIGNGTIGGGYDFTFVIDHVPPFDRREDNYNDAENIIQTELALHYQSGVDAFISGHNHVLAKQDITWSGDPDYPNSRNMTCLITGAGGAPNRTPKYGVWENTYGAGFYGKTDYCMSTYHYYVVEVDPSLGTATFTCYELGGTINTDASFTLNSFK